MEIYTHKIRDGRPKGCLFSQFCSKASTSWAFTQFRKRPQNPTAMSHQLMGSSTQHHRGSRSKSKICLGFQALQQILLGKSHAKMWVTCMLALFLPQKARHPSSLFEHHLNQTCMNATWCVGPKPRSFSTSASNADKRDKSTSQTMQSIKQLKEQCLVPSTKLEYMIFAYFCNIAHHIPFYTCYVQ